MALADKQALDAIHDAMDANEWNSDLWDLVAEIVLATGRPSFAPPDEEV